MGIVHSMYSESFPPKSKFSTADIPDLSGKIMIVTGGNAGEVLLFYNYCRRSV